MSCSLSLFFSVTFTVSFASFSAIVFSSLFSCHSSKLLENLIRQGGNRDNQNLNTVCCWVRPREDTIHCDQSLGLPIIFCPAGGLFWLTVCFVLTHRLQDNAVHNCTMSMNVLYLPSSLISRWTGVGESGLFFKQYLLWGILWLQGFTLDLFCVLLKQICILHKSYPLWLPVLHFWPVFCAWRKGEWKAQNESLISWYQACAELSISFFVPLECKSCTLCWWGSRMKTWEKRDEILEWDSSGSPCSPLHPPLPSDS